ncbi:MAG: arylsulfatase A-like enzyme, partial [Candidatus Azotimanducaceae bacterium]
MDDISNPPMDQLPPEPTPFRGVVNDTYAESTPDWPPPLRPPAGAPNIIVIMVDDLGFGQLSCFGGPIEAPHLSALADKGLRYTNFHTTALCSPSRAALLTGRNHHSVGFATIAEMASGFPGANAFLPKSAASIAEVLKQTGYSTYCAGKWHLTPTSEQTAAGPFDRWPIGL